MEKHVELLISEIGLEEDFHPLFETALIEKVNHFQKEDRYEFVIQVEDYLPIEVYKFFEKNISKCYPSSGEVTVKFLVKNNNFEKINEYFLFALKTILGNSPLVEMYNDCGFRVDENVVFITVANKAEKLKLNGLRKNIINFLKNLGFPDFKIKVDIDETKSECILKEEPAPVPVKKTKVENKIIFGNEIKSRIKQIDDLVIEEDNVAVECLVFAINFFETKKNNLKIITLKITDFSNSMYAKLFVNDTDVYNKLKSNLKESSWYRIKGFTKNDSFAKEIVLNVRDITKIDKKVETVKDESVEKRVELHAHTFMSQMDGLIPVKKLISYAKQLGHKAVAITDHNSVQSFPDAYNEMKYSKDDFKVIFGAEMVMINDDVKIISKDDNRDLTETTYVVFDFETTGFNAGGSDQIIEVGAVKLKGGKILDTFSKLIDPKRELPAKITEITKITDEMLKGQEDEETVIKQFIEWFGDLPLVAHNAKFDVSFLERAYNVYNLGEFNNTVIDTLELSRTLDSSSARHSLSALVKRYAIPFNENEHHRADYDAKATALIFDKMVKKLVNQNFEIISDLQKVVSKEDIFKFGRSFHINILAKNKIGLKNLFKLISYANTDFLHKTPRIPRSEIEKLREGLLIGSSCYMSEVFVEARSKTEEELRNIVTFYDYIELQPVEVYDHLLQTGEFQNKIELIETIKKIIRVADEAGVLIVATGDVHHLEKADKVYREIIVNQKVPGGGLHPLSKKNIHSIPSVHFRTTDEMIAGFDFLDKEIAKEIVVGNSNKIADMIEKYEVIVDTGGVPFSPKIENADKEVREMVYTEAKKIYGDKLPLVIEERIESELHGIIGGGFDVIYLISHKLVKKSNDDGYLVGSRGSVGSSFVATLMGITEVNPMPAHYVCPKCKKSIFEENGRTLGSVYSSGYDLPRRTCECGEEFIREGQDMPFATFLGFNADKVPDIDLNFSGDYQWRAHEYTKELFGVDNVLRAGTIGTVADKTAFGFVKGFIEDKNLIMRSAEIERLAMGCTGVKRTTGQHPGGIIVVPDYKEVFDFTPYQYPADDVKSLWRTSHFDYHAIDENLLKLDILGHDDPTVLKMLGDLSGIDVTKINPTDEKVMQIFSSPEVLGVKPEQILCETGTLGVPEFGTKFVIGMLMDTKPKTFGELLKISGLSHGTDVWLGNAQDLIKNNICDFKDVIGCRDDIMVYLMYNGLDPKDAFQIMEFVRKGKPSKDPEKWKSFEEKMKEKNVPDWYIDSCFKIKYMFPKAHASAYVLSALRIAWFKVHKPIYYYAASFSVRCQDFDVDALIGGYEKIRNLVVDLTNKGYDITNKESSTLEDMHMALEASARGIKFSKIDVDKSDAVNFIVLDDNTLLPPFRAIEGLGDQVAKKIVAEREIKPFLSIEDLQKRGKVNATTIEKMRFMGMLDHLDESSQLSLF